MKYVSLVFLQLLCQGGHYLRRIRQKESIDVAEAREPLQIGDNRRSSEVFHRLRCATRYGVASELNQVAEMKDSGF